jgi:hypothetical protein
MKTFLEHYFLQLENHNYCSCSARLDTSIAFLFNYLPLVNC